MKQLWRQLDQLLRSREALRNESALKELRVAQLIWACVVLGVIYGFFMGWYAVFSRPEAEYRQVIADMAKVPALFVLTLFICFPSLYVFSTILGARLSFGAALNLLLAVVAMTVLVLASLGPIVAFFALSTENYYFMKLLNVAFFAVAGVIGVGALLKALRMLLASATESNVPPPIGQRDPAARQINAVFRVWVLIYAAVGAQMAWVLRPFLCDPQQPFTWFRARHANFFVDVWHSLTKLFQ